MKFVTSKVIVPSVAPLQVTSVLPVIEAPKAWPEATLTTKSLGHALGAVTVMVWLPTAWSVKILLAWTAPPSIL